MCGLDCTMNVLLDTHGRVMDIVFRVAPRSPPRGDPPLQRRLRLRVVRPGARSRRTSPISSVFAPTDHLFHQVGGSCGRPRRARRRHAHLHEPLTGCLDGDRRLPGVRAHGSHEAVRARDARELRACAPRHPRARRSRCRRLYLGPDLRGDDPQHLAIVVNIEENLEMAADIGLDVTTSLDDALGAALARHGDDAKIVVLPYARYQLPRNAVRMEPASGSCSPTRAVHSGEIITKAVARGCGRNPAAASGQPVAATSMAPRSSRSCGCSPTGARRA